MHSFCNREKSKTADFLPGALRVKKKKEKRIDNCTRLHTAWQNLRTVLRVSVSLLSLNELPIEIYAVVKPKTIFFFKLDPCNVLARTVTRFLVRYIRKSKFCLILTKLNSVKFIFRGLRVFSVTPFLVDVTFLLLAE